MNKKLKRITSIALSAIALSSAGSFVGCGRGGGIKPDPNKSQLTIGNYDGGLGHDWLENIIDKFEADYADYSFEENKVGCQIWVDNRLTEYAGDQLLAGIPYGKASIICTQSCDYSNLVANDVLHDITGWLQEDVYDDDGNLIYDETGKIVKTGATRSVLDGLQAEYEAHYNVNGKYYAMPFSQLIAGMWYDADLFDMKGYYFFANGSIGAKQADVDAGLGGKGPDGKSGTSDDGLPATWKQFRSLMQTMKTGGVIPFTWDGAHNYQRSWFFTAVMASYEGYDDMLLNYSLTGQDSNQSEINVTGLDTVGLLAQQNGRKAACYAVRDIVASGNYSSAAFNGAQTHTGAQREFLESTNTSSPIAMFIEGSYWLNEARDVCDEMEKLNPEWGYAKRNVRYMPIPRFEADGDLPAQESTDMVLSSQLDDTAILVKKNLECEELTKLFYQYLHSRESMVICERDTLTFRPFDYQLVGNEYNELPQIVKSIREKIDEGARIINNLPKSSLAKNTLTKRRDWLVAANISKNNIGSTQDIFYVFKDYASLTWQEYYEGIVNSTVGNFPLAAN